MKTVYESSSTVEEITNLQERNLRKLADFLLNLETRYKHFDMQFYMREINGKSLTHNIFDRAKKIDEVLKTHCNSVACAVGHGPTAGISIKEYESWQNYCNRCFTRNNYIFFEWCFGSKWKNIDNTPTGAALRIIYALEFGVPKDFSGMWYPSKKFKKMYMSEYDVVTVDVA